jgi:outer membrane protein assembly factor BamE
MMVALLVAACKQNPELPAAISPYRIDIQQGNVVTQEMVSKLKAGLTRSQVRFVLGSPLVTDMFHGDRWDYVFLMQRQGRPDERRRLTVIFDDDKLLRLEGDVVLTDAARDPQTPALKPPAAPAAVAKPAAAKPVAAAPTPKPEAAKPAEKPPVVAAPAATAVPAAPIPKPEARPAEAPPVVAAPAVPPAAPAVAPASNVKPAPEKSAAPSVPPAADGKRDAMTAAAKPAATPAVSAAAAAPRTEVAKADDKKDDPERGLFGRMLDRVGF